MGGGHLTWQRDRRDESRLTGHVAFFYTLAGEVKAQRLPKPFFL